MMTGVKDFNVSRDKPLLHYRVGIERHMDPPRDFERHDNWLHSRRIILLFYYNLDCKKLISTWISKRQRCYSVVYKYPG